MFAVTFINVNVNYLHKFHKQKEESRRPHIDIYVYLSALLLLHQLSIYVSMYVNMYISQLRFTFGLFSIITYYIHIVCTYVFIVYLPYTICQLPVQCD